MSRILIVEDEPAIAFGLDADLSAEGYEVEVAADGDTALVLARARAFDLILLDVMLPGKDGFEVCRELRRSGLQMPILFLTARGQVTEKAIGLDLGADDYVTKPFSPMELRARIRALLRRGSPAESPEIARFGDLELDHTRGELRRAGRPVDLTPTEFKILSAFLKNRGRVLSRDRLIDLAWGPGTFVTERVVDNYIVSLRKKLESTPGAPQYLVNVRGQGYRFDG